MKKYFMDILYCIKIAVYIFIAVFLIGAMIGFIVSKGNIFNAINLGSKLNMYLSLFGLFISAISFTNEKFMRPLNYEETWKNYFHRLNLAFVIFIICIVLLISSVILQDIIWAYLNK
ncbi:hypothetical protein [Clostridium rectalis]|uniref:hypothetical protein n=1 Tax=Clostridium rectalis TaxID=2040295 RepID=UPI000F644260|nr:hypothetical protein [Clostridium rectalis]